VESIKNFLKTERSIELDKYMEIVLNIALLSMVASVLINTYLYLY
jgi:hypothetical protein